MLLNKWLSLFESPNINYTEFIRIGMIQMNNGTLITLKRAIKEKGLTLEETRALYQVIVTDKNKYLTNFYNRSLKPYPMNIIEISVNNDKHSNYKNIIRNIYYKEILLNTKTIQPNIRSFMDVILDLFKHRIIDYKLITPSSLSLITKFKLSNVLAGFYFRSSILNPMIPYSISTHISSPFKVFTPTLGWSSYLFGMLSNSHLKEYVGVDVIKKVCDTTTTLANNRQLKNNIYCVPSEDLWKDTIFLRKYKAYFDFIFFSPPYYQLELYPGSKQSTTRYKSYEEWLEGYWRQTIKLCHHVLKRNKYMFFIISGYKYKNKYIDIEADLNHICKEEKFTYIKKIPMKGKNIGFTSHRQASENIYVYTSGDNPIPLTNFLRE